MVSFQYFLWYYISYIASYISVNKFTVFCNVQVIQECTLANTLSLWDLLSVEQAKQLTLINQVCMSFKVNYGDNQLSF